MSTLEDEAARLISEISLGIFSPFCCLESGSRRKADLSYCESADYKCGCCKCLRAPKRGRGISNIRFRVKYCFKCGQKSV